MENPKEAIKELDAILFKRRVNGDNVMLYGVVLECYSPQILCGVFDGISQYINWSEILWSLGEIKVKGWNFNLKQQCLERLNDHQILGFVWLELKDIESINEEATTAFRVLELEQQLQQLQ